MKEKSPGYVLHLYRPNLKERKKEEEARETAPTYHPLGFRGARGAPARTRSQSKPRAFRTIVGLSRRQGRAAHKHAVHSPTISPLNK